jgi:hypothetical protein
MCRDQRALADVGACRKRRVAHTDIDTGNTRVSSHSINSATCTVAPHVIQRHTAHTHVTTARRHRRRDARVA